MRAFDKRLRAYLYASLFCALTVVGAYIRIPLVPPITLQFLFTNVSALVLGRRFGALSVLLYITLGLAGLPVFTFGGGIGSVLSPTFGYTLGLLVGAYLGGAVAQKSKSTPALVAASLLNMLAVYVFGCAHFLFIKNLYLSETVSISESIAVCILPFILFDVIKAAISILLAKRLYKIIG